MSESFSLFEAIKIPMSYKLDLSPSNNVIHSLEHVCRPPHDYLYASVRTFFSLTHIVIVNFGCLEHT
jgi:hypothetical protein